jgi:hypothetical protein
MWKSREWNRKERGEERKKDQKVRPPRTCVALEWRGHWDKSNDIMES